MADDMALAADAGWQPISNHSGYEAVVVCRAAEPQRAAIRAFRGIDGEWRALLPDGSSERLRFTPTHFQPDLELPEAAANPSDEQVERVARAAMFGAEIARTDVVNPANGSAPYSYVEFHGQRVEFHDGEFDTAFERDAGSAKAAAYAAKVNDALFGLAKRAARAALTNGGEHAGS